MCVCCAVVPGSASSIRTALQLTKPMGVLVGHMLNSTLHNAAEQIRNARADKLCTTYNSAICEQCSVIPAGCGALSWIQSSKLSASDRSHQGMLPGLPSAAGSSCESPCARMYCSQATHQSGASKWCLSAVVQVGRACLHVCLLGTLSVLSGAAPHSRCVWLHGCCPQVLKTTVSLDDPNMPGWSELANDIVVNEKQVRVWRNVKCVSCSGGVRLESCSRTQACTHVRLATWAQHQYFPATMVTSRTVY